MKKALLAVALLGLWETANAIPVPLVAHNQVSSDGTLSTLIWTGANATTTSGMVVSAMASTATWDWDGTVLTSAGYFQTTSHIGSMESAASVISDVVVDLVINTAAKTTSATTYECREGNFLSSVGAHGCAAVSLGGNVAYDSSIAYNVGGDVNCINRTVGGDDKSIGDPRGLSTPGSGGGCDVQAGAFDLWTIAVGDMTIGGTLILSNGRTLEQIRACQRSAGPCAKEMFGASWLTFTEIPVPAAGWLIAPAVLAAARFARRRKASA
jgi:hypothetical protein